MPNQGKRGGAPRFESTRWSMVVAAGHPSSPDCREALETLCRTYWYPLYAFLRRRGCPPEEAEDLTQAFFVHMLDKQDFKLADQERGKFRSFLLTSLKHFVANERRRAYTRKRGGGSQHFPLDFGSAEGQYLQEPAHGLTPEELFERSWAMTILDRTMARLESEFVGARKRKQFGLLSRHLIKGDVDATYSETGAALDITEGAVKTAVYRLRKRYRELLSEEIAQTVESKKDIDQEVRDLFAVLST